ncbi:hypothetical protein CW703_05715 [Candidatus Bathyarchaeota archaeon]|nr:MAG: hypothetical protein CW703_05715 [Candidatus Bathyarchaeota archaeon]
MTGSSTETFTEIVKSVIVIAVLVYFLYCIFQIPPFSTFWGGWWNAYGVYLIIVIIAIIVIIVIVGGLKIYFRLGETSYSLPSTEAAEAAREEKPAEDTLFQKVVEAIRNFEPSRRYRNEFGYHTELQGYLKSHFPGSKVELKTGSSRPDIVIGDIAIEVKGPTTSRELQTIPDKIIRYSRYYPKIIVVLFEPKVNPRLLHEWRKGLRETRFPRLKALKIIVKPYKPKY